MHQDQASTRVIVSRRTFLKLCVINDRGVEPASATSASKLFFHYTPLSCCTLNESHPSSVSTMQNHGVVVSIRITRQSYLVSAENGTGWCNAEVNSSLTLRATVDSFFSGNRLISSVHTKCPFFLLMEIM